MRNEIEALVFLIVAIIGCCYVNELTDLLGFFISAIMG